MATKVHRSGFENAKQLILKGRTVADEKDDWSEHQPNTQEENEFIRRHGLEEYGRWHLGIDDEQPEHVKGRYKFPYGDFQDVHRCALFSVESTAEQYKYGDIGSAAAHLHGMIAALKR